MSPRAIAALALAANLLLSPAADAAKALLIGVARYPWPLDALEGPAHDVPAMARTLRQHWALAASDVRTLLDAQASKPRILAEIDALLQRSAPGEHVLIYFSGHGTSAFDPDARLPLPTTSGALVPFLDSPPDTRERWLDALIIGRRDLNPRFQQLDNGGRRVLVVIDACYSGNTVRGAYARVKLQSRYVNWTEVLPARRFADDIGPYGSNTPGYQNAPREPAPYPYNNVFYLGASGEHEEAQDIPSAMLTATPTLDGSPHGAFTDALLRVLSGALPADNDGDGSLSYGELYASLRAFMHTRPYAHTPARLPSIVDDTQNLAARPLFDRPAPAPPPPAPGDFSVAVQGFAGLAASLRGRGIAVRAQNAVLRVRRDRDTTLLIARGGDLITRLKTVVPAEVEAAVVAEQAVHAWMNAPFKNDFMLLSGLQGPAPGSTRVAGDTLGFSVQPARPAHLLLVNIGPTASLHVLYPWPGERPPRPTTRFQDALHDIARVNTPFGREIVDIYAFERWPAELDRYLGGGRYPVDSPEALALRRTLMQHQGARARSTLTIYTTQKP